MCVLSFSKISFMDVGALALGYICSELRLCFLVDFFPLMDMNSSSPFFLLFVAEILFFGC